MNEQNDVGFESSLGEVGSGSSPNLKTQKLRSSWFELFGGLVILWAILLGFAGAYSLLSEQSSGAIITLAAVICGIAGTIAYFVVWFTRGTGYSMEGMLASMLFRTLIPLVSAPCVAVLLPDSNKANIFENFVVFYLLTLFMETLLSVHLTKRFDDRIASLKDAETSQ